MIFFRNILCFFGLLSYSLCQGQSCPGQLITSQEQLDSSFKNCATIAGDLIIGEAFVKNNITNLDVFSNLYRVQGDFIIQNTRITNTDFLAHFLGPSKSLFIRDNDLLDSINLPFYNGQGGNFEIVHNAQLKKVDGFFSSQLPYAFINIIENPELESIAIFERLATVPGGLVIRDCGSLKTLDGLDGLRTCSKLELKNLPLLKDISALSSGPNRLSSSRDIWLENCGIETVVFLNQLDSIRWLTIRDCRQLKDLSGLSDWQGRLGEIEISGSDSLRSLSGLDSVSVSSVLRIENHELLETVGFNKVNNLFELYVSDNSSLVRLNGLSALRRIKDRFEISHNNSLEDLSNLKEFERIENSNNQSSEGLLLIDNPSLQTQDFFPALVYIGGDLRIEACGMDTLSGFERLEKLKKRIIIEDNAKLLAIKEFSQLSELWGYFSLNNKALKEIDVGNNLNIAAIVQFSDCPHLKSISSLDRLDEASILIYNCPELDSISPLTGYKKSVSSLSFNNTGLKTLDFFTNLDTICSQFLINNNQELNSLEAMSSVVFVEPCNFSDWFQIINNDQLITMKGLEGFMGTFNSSVEISENDNLRTLNGLENVSQLGRFLILRDNAALANLDALSSLQSVRDSVVIIGNASLSDISGLSNLEVIHDFFFMGGLLRISDNPLLDSCEVLCELKETADIPGGIHLSGNGGSCSALPRVLSLCAGLDFSVTGDSTITDTEAAGGAKWEVDVYPNPVVDEMTIAVDGDSDWDLGLYCSDGRLLERRRARGIAVVDFSGKASGFYVLEIRGMEGNLVKRIKVIKR